MTKRQGWARGLRIGCAALLAVLLVAALAGGGLALFSWQRARSEAPEPYAGRQAVPGGESDDSHSPAGRIEIDVEIAQAVLVPGPPGSSLEIEAEFDPRRFALTQTTDRAPDGRWVWRIDFRPIGSSAIAILAVKLGGRPPTLRIAIPRGVPVELDGRVRGAFAALELGGLRVNDIDLDVESGAVALSFVEPLAAPMKSLQIFGDRGSVEVTGLGNASPQSVQLGQHLGELDIDLRGAWVRDSDIRLDVWAAGGTVWLPRNVVVEGLPGRAPKEMSEEEIPAPRLRMDVGEHLGRLVIVD